MCMNDVYTYAIMTKIYMFNVCSRQQSNYFKMHLYVKNKILIHIIRKQCTLQVIDVIGVSPRSDLHG